MYALPIVSRGAAACQALTLPNLVRCFLAVKLLSLHPKSDLLKLYFPSLALDFFSCVCVCVKYFTPVIDFKVCIMPCLTVLSGEAV